MPALTRTSDHRLTVARLARSMRPVPSIGIVLGSGFGGVRREMTEQRSWSYAELPGFPVGKVPGHECRLLWGTLGGVPVVVLSGRAHYYEGFDLDQVTYPVRVLAALGLKVLLLTNASGGIRAGLRPGDFMAISDHINFLGVNPLRGVQRQSHLGLKGGAGFTDLTEAYDPELRQIMRSAGRAAGVRVKQGVYLAVSGPSYETPAEIRAFGRWGADAVGMSTVAETIVARHCGLRVAGLSGVTNLAAGRGGKGVRLNHEDVLAQAQSREAAASRLVLEFVKKCSQHLIGTNQTHLA